MRHDVLVFMYSLNFSTEKFSFSLIVDMYFFSFLFSQDLRAQLTAHFNKAKDLNSRTRTKYQEYGQSLPSDAAQKVKDK